MTQSAAKAFSASNELWAFLSKLRVSHELAQVAGDAFVPLLSPDGDDWPDAQLLDEALADGTTSLREVDELGDVNRVRVEHRGDRLLLLLDGEQIIGAKQNRVLNASFLIPSGADVDVPVSCVEKGRWRYEDANFRSGEITLTGIARSRKLRRVTESIIVGRGYDADQRAVWDDVDDYLDRTRVVSKTAALDDGIASRRDSTSRRLEALAPLKDQVGIAQVRGGRLVLMDLLGSPDLYVRGYVKIAGGMLADGGEPEPNGDAHAVVGDALQRMVGSTALRRSAPGCGETLHGGSGDLVFGAVAYRGRVFHATISGCDERR